MKQHLRMTFLFAATIGGVALLFFAPGSSSRVQNYYRTTLRKPAADARRPRSSRGSSADETAPDYAKTLNKTLTLDGKHQVGMSFAPQDPTPKVQESKLAPDVFSLVGPVSQDQDLRKLPYIPVTNAEEEEERLMRYPPKEGQKQAVSDPIVISKTLAPSLNMPSPLNTFAGMTQNLGCGGCLPPDTDGDVGPNHYMQAVNSSLRIHDKAGAVLAGPITFNAFFAALGPSTPCGNNQNQGDPVVFYDHIADRWVVSDFAFAAFPGTSFYQCIGVSKTSDPVAGGYWLYAVQVDPANNNFLGDYPKFGLWPDAYYLSVNMFSNNTTFNGVRMFALNRNQMINGGPANTIAFTITPADIGAEYSLVPASFRTGLPPPAGQPEWFMSINSSAVGGTVENQVFVRRFHADFVTPANSVFGVGASHAPDGVITVANFVDAFDSAGDTSIVPNGTATATQFLDTLGDKLMYPLIYQNLAGVESAYVSHSVNNNQAGTGPVSVRWYQFNLTGNTIPAVPTQQQTFNNGGDGLWRWMPSINVDWQGNLSIGYSASSTTVDPGIRYAGRLVTDPPNTLAQGEAIMTPGTGHQTSTQGRWGDYSSLFVDPNDGCTFYHTNEYYSSTSGAAWNTRVGSYKFPTCTPSPIPTPTPAASPTPTPVPTPPVSAGPVTVTATAATVGPTDYPTVKAAFDAINLGTHQGAINIFILGNTSEAASAVLNASGGPSSYTSITMQPTGGAARTVSGNLALPLIDFNGADNVTVDGTNSGGNSLTITNTNNSATANTSTIRFIGGASNNTIIRSTILGSFSGTLATNGGTIYFSTDTVAATGNDNNTISFCNVGPATGVDLPSKGIFALGSTGIVPRNSGVVINNNNIFDFFRDVNTSGIHILSGNDGWTVSNNRLYQTAPRVFTSAASRYAGITLNSTAATTGVFTLTGNVIGFGAANGTGTTTISGSSNEFRGLDLPSVSSTTATSIQGNTISGINQTTSRASTTVGLASFIGIAATSTAGGTAAGIFTMGNLAGNTIGSLDGSSTIVVNATSVTASTAPVQGILVLTPSSNNISNNRIGAITIQGSGTATGFRGILTGVATGAASTQTLLFNMVGGAVAGGAITDTQVGDYSMYGIQVATASLTAQGNFIRSLNGNANGAVVVMGGILTSGSTGVNTISQNVIYGLNNTVTGGAAGALYGIDCSLPATANIVERNFVHSLSVTSTLTAYQIWGIVMRGVGTATFKNNMVRLGIDAAGNSITTGFSIIGMRDIAGATANYQFNSVYIGGTGVVSVSNTFAFNSNVVTNTRNIQDNIFYNARSNASGAIANVAITVGGTTPNPAGLTSNFNDLFASGTDGVVGVFNTVVQPTLANWQTATGQDANSISANPNFAAPDAPATNVNLHLQTVSPAKLAGTPIATVTNDFDNDPRPPVTPDIGADQAVTPTAAPAIISGQITTADGAPLGGVVVRLSGGRSAMTITDSNGAYRFTNVDTDSFYNLTPSLTNYQFAPSELSFSLLGNKSDAVFTGTRSGGFGNPLDTPEFFVRQHYLDFLGREPDQSGLNFWSEQIRECGGDSGCIERRTVNVSAAYFLSIEFQHTGGLVDGLYRASYGRRPQYAEFVPDARSVGRGVVVGQDEWLRRLLENKRAFVAEWVGRADFRAAYDGLSNSQYVEALIEHTGVSFTAVEREALVSGLANGSQTRGEVLRSIVEDERFVRAKRNEMFVMMEYFGYLHRNPDEAGYRFWLNKLNEFNGNFEQAEMVKAFIVSGEYRARFGQ